MKFTLTITDMTEDDVYDIISSVKHDTPQVTVNKVEVDLPQPTAPVETAVPQPTAPVETAVPQPTAPVETAVPQPTTPELDSDGLPWDERIHAASKKQNKDGTWKQRRGTDDETKKQVEAELRGQVKQDSLPAEATPVAPQPEPQVAAPVAPQPEPQVAAPTNSADVQNTTMQQVIGKMQEIISKGNAGPQFALQMIQDLNTTYYKQYKSIVDIGDDQFMLDNAMRYMIEKAGQ